MAALCLLHREPELCSAIAQNGFKRYLRHHSPELVWGKIMSHSSRVY